MATREDVAHLLITWHFKQVKTVYVENEKYYTVSMYEAKIIRVKNYKIH